MASQVFVTAMLCIVAWLFFRFIRRKRADALFGVNVTGGRAGFIHMRLEDKTALAEYEIGTKGLIVYESSFRWSDRDPFSQHDHQVFVSTLQEWSSAGGPSLEIASGA
jgi:hypothetical protein